MVFKNDRRDQTTKTAKIKKVITCQHIDYVAIWSIATRIVEL